MQNLVLIALLYVWKLREKSSLIFNPLALLVTKNACSL